MRDVMRALTAAREGAWFKKEQEAEVWEYRKRLIREGKWDKGAFETSKDAKRNVEAAAEVLAEILQADARITSKDAMLAREVVRHGKSLPPGWRDAALRNAARRHAPAAIAHPLGTGDVSLKRGAVPRVDLGELRRCAFSGVRVPWEGRAAAPALTPGLPHQTGRRWSSTSRWRPRSAGR